MATGARQLLSRVFGKLTPFTPSGDIVLNEDGSFTVTNASNVKGGAATLKTIASGAFALSAGVGNYKVEGEGAAADNLDTMTGGVEGQRITIRPYSASHPITLRDVSVSSASADGIATPAQKSVTLTQLTDFAVLERGATHWTLVAYRTQAADLGSARLKFFKSTEQTGTGSAQNIAHGLGVTPGLVFAFVTDAGSTYVLTEGTHDATNVVVTVTSGKKFKVIAIAP